ACVVDARSGEVSVHRLAGTTNELAAFWRRLPVPVCVSYEAGPTGFELARALEAAGVVCVVAAPGKIERPAQDRVKTDPRRAARVRPAAGRRGRPPAPRPAPRREGPARRHPTPPHP